MAFEDHLNSVRCIVIPAAGASRRLGTPKQMVQFEGESLIRRAAKTALDVLPDVIIVTGCEDVAVRREVQDLPVAIVDNPDWEKGMGTSIAVGARAAIDRFPELIGILIHLCDMPLIDAAHLKNLVREAGRSDSGLAYTEYEDTEGVPALFGRLLFEELLFLDGDRGAKQVIERTDNKTPVKFNGLYVDIDLPEDLDANALNRK